MPLQLNTSTTSRRLESPQSRNPGRPNPSGRDSASPEITSTAPATTSPPRAVAEVAPTTVSSKPISLVR